MQNLRRGEKSNTPYVSISYKFKMAASTGTTKLFLVITLLGLTFGDEAQTKNPRDFLKKEHSLMRPYTGAGASLPMWDIQGNTMVTNSYIRLTPDKQSKQGAIWNKLSNRSPHWEMHVQFKVHGQGRTLFGDGFALWYTKDRMKIGDVFGNADYHTGIGLFFDTYSNHNGPHNHQHPYISAQINNGTLHYDHDRDGTHTEVAGCHAPFRNKPHDTHVAMRFYANRLTVMVDIDGQQNWKECIDVPGIRLPTGYFFGASAATGELADNHDIMSIKVYELTLEGGQDESVDYADIAPSADFFAPPRDHIDDPQGAFKNITLTWRKTFLFTFCVILGVLVCIIVGFVIFRRKQDYNKKRFY